MTATGTCRIASTAGGGVEEKLTRTAFTDDDKAFIESAAFFFIATADAQGRPDCSFKAGMPGFVRVTGAGELAFPDYDGNGMFKSLGNLLVNPNIGLLFIAMNDKPKRLRVNGSARVSDRDPLLGETVGAQLIVRVEARAILPNCPRYIPAMQMVSPSIYTPQPKCEPPEPAWKSFIPSRTPCTRASRRGRVRFAASAMCSANYSRAALSAVGSRVFMTSNNPSYRSEFYCSLQCLRWPMSALGQKQTFAV